MKDKTREYPEDTNQLANDHFFAGQFDKALYYSFLDVEKSAADWPVVRLASVVKKVVGLDQSIFILEKHLREDRGANYKYALLHTLCERGDFRRALEISETIGESDNVEPQYICSEIEMLCRLKKITEAEHKFNARRSLLARSNTAHFQALRCLVSVSTNDDFKRTIVDHFISTSQELTEDQRFFLAWTDVKSSRSSLLVAGLSDSKRRLLDEAAAFYEAYPASKCAALASARLSETSSDFMEVRKVAQFIAAAVQEHRPLSLVRLGDGEGRFVDSLENYPEIATGSREIARRVWFWNSVDFPEQSFFEELKGAYLDADIVGINPAQRITFEFHNSIPGYVGVVKGNQFIFDQGVKKGRYVTHNWATVTLQSMDFYRRLLGSIDSVSIISPYTHIGEVMAGLGAKRVSGITIPSEGHYLLRDSSLKEPHYPQAFRRVREQIRRNGKQVYLVAGGVFGKIYCADIKKAGGIAIDIGSLIDQWVGLKTR